MPSWATHPLINSGVIGQDSVQATRHGDDIFWFFGDTNRVDYPLGNPDAGEAGRLDWLVDPADHDAK